MKNLNNSMDNIHDKYIEEAAQSVRLQSTAGRTVRNIAIPVVSAAAIAGLCFGMSRLGVFGGSKGVDLLPAASGNDTAEASGAETSLVIPGELAAPEEPVFPEQIPVVQKTQADIESIIFGSEFPDMLYADEEKAVFTDGIGGVYSFDFAAEQITLAIDIADSMELVFDDFPEDFGGDSWNGISLFALGNGQLCCSVSARKNITYTGAGESVTEHYFINTDTMTLDTIVGFELADFDIYSGLFDIPYGQGYHELGINGAKIGDTGEYVYIRNCTADIDLLPMYDMQYIELRRLSEDQTDTSVIAEAMEGGYYPFTDDVGVYAEIEDCYQLEGYTQTCLTLDAGGQDSDTFTFIVDPLASYRYTGIYKACGDLLRLDFADGEYVIYRCVDGQLIPCPFGAFAADSYSKLKTISETVLIASDPTFEALRFEIEQVADDIELLEKYCAEIEARISQQKEHINDLSEAQINADPDISADIEEQITAREQELLDYEQLLVEIKQNINEMINQKSDLESAAASRDESYEQQLRLAEYLSMLCRGSDFDGNYTAPNFVNILDGEWFVSTVHGYDSWRGGTHNGIDIVADKGDPIYAADSGTARVPDVGNDMFGGNGNTVVIEHDSGYFTVYAHADKIHVQDGEHVEQGQHIADVGNTGWSTGPHLHFEVYKGQTSMDPLTWSWFDGEAYNTNSSAYAIYQSFEERSPATEKPENLWYPIDTSYEFSMCPDYSNCELSFNGLQGVAINAMADGEVIYVGKMKYADGVSVFIKQTDGFVAEYSMVDECIVNVGDNVKAGLKIGQVGEWIEFRISIADSYYSTLNPDDIVFDTRCLYDVNNALCGYPTAEDMSAPFAAMPIDPSLGVITEVMYGSGGYYGHNGIDISAERGTPVSAVDDGTVILAEWYGDYGNCVMLRHDSGIITVYGHLDSIQVSDEQRVTHGDIIAESGSTGRATGNQLHFEVRIDDTPVDPMEWLPDYPISSDCIVF